MKRISILAATLLLLLLLPASRASAFGVKDVVKMNDDGVADSLIILKVENSGKTFHLDADDMHALREAGVSDGVISAMLRTEGRDWRDRDYGDAATYYPHGYYPYGHVYLGFGYRHYGYYGSRFYGSRLYGGYRYPRYRSYTSQPYSGNYGTQRYRGSYGSRPGTSGSGAGSRPSTSGSGGSGAHSRRR